MIDKIVRDKSLVKVYNSRTKQSDAQGRTFDIVSTNYRQACLGKYSQEMRDKNTVTFKFHRFLYFITGERHA